MSKIIKEGVLIIIFFHLGLALSLGQNNIDMETKNVLGTALKMCCSDPVTGYFRDGHCNTGPTDFGTHIVCARVTDKFLEYSKCNGNDLITPLPIYNFPGLQAGDKWCLCISRWQEAYEAGVAPPIDLEATHEKALDYVPIEVLKLNDIKVQN